MNYVPLYTLAAWLVAGAVSWAAGPVSIHVQDVPVRTVIEGLARSNQLNVMIDDTVQGTITLHVDDVPAETALQAILDSRHLFCREQDGIRTITGVPAEKVGKQYYTWQLAYAAPAEMADAAQAIVTKENVRHHDETNSLVIGGTWHDAQAINQLVQKLDRPAQQVNVEAKIMSVDKNALRQTGVDWNWSAIEGGSGHGVFAFTSQIQALAEKGKAKLLASPHITAVNGKEAHILIGDKIPVVTEHLTNGEKTATTEYEEAGIKLTYVPRIQADGSIFAAIEAEVSTPVYVPELKAYRIATRQARTSVRMQEHEPIVIGGLIRKEDIENFRKVPLLGDIPLLGKLFQSRYVSAKETEVVIIVKAQVVAERAGGI